MATSYWNEDDDLYEEVAIDMGMWTKYERRRKPVKRQEMYPGEFEELALVARENDRKLGRSK